MGNTKTHQKEQEREERRVEGEARNAAWQSLTKEQKIASLRGRRDASKRQLTKLGGLS